MLPFLRERMAPEEEIRSNLFAQTLIVLYLYYYYYCKILFRVFRDLNYVFGGEKVKSACKKKTSNLHVERDREREGGRVWKEVGRIDRRKRMKKHQKT